MNGWRDRLPAFAVGFVGTAGGVLLLAYHPGDQTAQIVVYAMVVLFGAILAAVVLDALGVSGPALRWVIPAGTVAGGVLLVIGFAVDGVLLQFLALAVGLELALVVLWLLWSAVKRIVTRLSRWSRR